MPDYIVTGKKGSGKGLSMVGRMGDYIRRGSAVATNMDLHLRELVEEKPTAPVYRVSDLPTIEDLRAIGIPNLSYDENKNGGLFLDECAAFLNSRSWNAKGREEIIVWLAHARKLGWDVFFQVQSLSMLDKQVRESFGEYIVTCGRLDRLKVPVIGRFAKMLTFGLWDGSMPKIHIAGVRYGTGPTAILADRWTYRGVKLYNAYDTKQKIGTNDCAVHSLIWYETAQETEDRQAAAKRGPKPKLPDVARLRTLPRDRQWYWAKCLAA